MAMAYLPTRGERRKKKGKECEWEMKRKKEREKNACFGFSVVFESW
jgi:hypothetical protein